MKGKKSKMINQKNEKLQNKILVVVPRAVQLVTSFGASLAKQKNNHVKITSVITTVSNPEIERREVNEAGAILNINAAYFLKYKTGGLKEIGLDNLKEDIYKIFAEEKPDIVITLARHGYNEDPDISRSGLATIVAYEKFVSNFIDTEENEKKDEDKKTCKLYCYVYPQEFLKFAEKKGFLLKDYFGFHFESVPDKKITHVIDVKNFINKKIEALKTQKLYENEAQKMINFLENYKSAGMDHFVLHEKSGEKVSFTEFPEIKDRF